MTNIKKRIGIGVAIIICVILALVAIISADINGNKIVKNTYVNDINIGGMDKDQAKEKLEQIYILKNLNLKYSDKTWDLNPKELNVSYSINDTIKDAYNINRDSDLFNNLSETLQSYFGKKNNIQIKLDYSEDKIKENLEKIAEEIDVQVQDAKLNISGSSISVEEEKDGIKLNIDKTFKNILKELESGNVEIDLKVDTVEAKIKKEQLKEVDTLLGSHSTKFKSSVVGRTTNIKLATDRTSDVLLMPGDTFSYNEHTGKRTVENGYKNAPVIVQGVMQEGIGGGVCQVSTTLYNAVLYSGLEFVNIKNHSIPSTYAEKGRDATVTDSGIDFVFKNNYEYPVYVKNYVSGNYVTCQIYGSSKNKQNIQISTSLDGVSSAPIKKVEDPTLPKGEEKELEKGRDAYTVSTFRIYKDSNGNIIKKVKVATSYYPKKQGVIAIGTKEDEQLPVEPPIEQPTEPPIEQPVIPPVEPPTEQPVTPPVTPPVEPPAPETQPENNV
ncbi:MAG: VanW family protein [Peptostreptococcaceae bacterium]